MIIAKAMNIDRYDHWSYWFMHECAVHAMTGYWSCMKNIDHGMNRLLIMHDNLHIHVIMNIIVTPNGIMTQLREEVKAHRWNHRWNNRWNHDPAEGGIYTNYSILQGWIHHLARHAVACFLTRGDLWVSWEEGLKVFDELLLDADWWEFHSTQFCGESRALELPKWNIKHEL